MPRLGKTLASRILVAVLGIIVVTVGVAAALAVRRAAQTTDTQAYQQARSIAVTVAAMPDVAEAVTGGPTAALMPAIAEQIRAQAESQTDYIVIIDATGKRLSHPRPDLIGKYVEEPVVALDGQVHTAIDNGDLGRSVNVKAPVLDPSGIPVGEVSVGVLETTVSSKVTQELGLFLIYGGLALALGVLASLVLARTIKRVTFGLEPAEIVALVQEREAMLHGIREGVLGVDERGRVNVLNEEARRLLHLEGAQLGQPVADMLPAGQLRDIVCGVVDGPDRVAVTDEYLLVLNRMPVCVGGRQAGWVVTIRDRTEMEALLRELDSVTGLTMALRAQEHEFANRLHVLAVLLELGESDEAMRYSRELSAHTTLQAEDVRSRISSPVITALIIAKTSVAAEHDVLVTLDPDSQLQHADIDPILLVTILSNLVDNAVDAVSGDLVTPGRHPRGTVTVLITESANHVHVRVTDDGPGIPAEALSQVFVDGFTTKAPRSGMHRGIGLALVHRLVTRVGGTISVDSADGTVFDVRMPVSVRQPV